MLFSISYKEKQPNRRPFNARGKWVKNQGDGYGPGETMYRYHHQLVITCKAIQDNIGMDYGVWGRSRHITGERFGGFG